ncbi:unnamed protein product [Diatraea saccharalis]|uniref:Uncharacterized protein n=1 Tax=Diatraea saccharalis TaxID=40085 RepID=A0A9N9RA33_9NEOP|nr:unnamed protein product [Diatraea saccharalis]
MYRTGGGPSNAPEFTDVEAKVMSICSNIKGLDARHDSDTIKSVPISISDMFGCDTVTSKLDELSSARLELLQIQMETARKEQQHQEEEHKLKMQHQANDEKRKQEIHALLLQKLNYAPLSDDTICKHL